jgi:hypothetical protein
MNIRQYKRFEFQNNEYEYQGMSHYKNPISHVEMFLYRVFGYVNRAGGAVKFLNNLYALDSENRMTLEMVDLNIDTQKNLIYLCETFDAYEADMTEEEFNIKYNNMNALQLCQNNIIDCAVITKDNFVHLFNAWKEMYQNQSPFVLLYLDEKNWYDVLPFESQEAMEEFVATHTQQENKN